MNLITIKEVAKIFGVTSKTIRIWCNDGHLECIKTLGNHRRFDLDYINEYSKNLWNKEKCKNEVIKINNTNIKINCNNNE